MIDNENVLNSEGIKVSVIVLTCNHEKYIRQALDSILMQKVDFKYEILVGDDASTDRTVEIIYEYQGRYGDMVRLFLHESNVGATKNAYELLTNARGRYLATCEGDDYWTDEKKLQTQVDFLEQNPEYIGTTHRFLMVDENGITLKRQKLNWIKEKECFRFQDFQGLFLPGQPSTFVRRNIFLNSEETFTEIYTIHPMIADRTLMLLFLTRGNFYTIGQEMSCYRKKKDTNSSVTVKMYTENAERTEMDYELNAKLEEYARKLMGHEVVFEDRRKNLFTEALLAAFRQRNRRCWGLLRRMLKETKHPLILISSVPCCVWKKGIQKFKR